MKRRTSMAQRLSSFLFTIFLGVLLSTSLQAQEKKAETFHYVKFHTNKGDFTVKLYNDTPLHRDNFIRLVKNHAYDNLLFHRVIRNFMIQLGGAQRGADNAQNSKLQTLSQTTLPAEIMYPIHFHKRGALAAARVGNEENPERMSDGIQFYVVVGQFYLPRELKRMEEEAGYTMPAEVKQAYMTEGGTPHLDREYTVFGEVIDGMNTILKIQSSETDAEDKPLKDIYIKRTEISVK